MPQKPDVPVSVNDDPTWLNSGADRAWTPAGPCVDVRRSQQETRLGMRDLVRWFVGLCIVGVVIRAATARHIPWWVVVGVLLLLPLYLLVLILFGRFAQAVLWLVEQVVNVPRRLSGRELRRLRALEDIRQTFRKLDEFPP